MSGWRDCSDGGCFQCNYENEQVAGDGCVPDGVYQIRSCDVGSCATASTQCDPNSDSPMCCDGICQESCGPMTCPDAYDIALTRTGSSTWELSWNGSGGSGYVHLIFVDKDHTKVGCNSPGCYDANTSFYKQMIPKGSTMPHGPAVIENLTLNTLYYIHIVGYKSDSNNCPGGEHVLTSCDLFPPNLYIPVGGTGTITSITSEFASDADWGIRDVSFRIDPGTAYAEFSPHNSGDHHKWTDSDSPPYPRIFSANVSGLRFLYAGGRLAVPRVYSQY